MLYEVITDGSRIREPDGLPALPRRHAHRARPGRRAGHRAHRPPGRPGRPAHAEPGWRPGPPVG